MRQFAEYKSSVSATSWIIAFWSPIFLWIGNFPLLPLNGLRFIMSKLQLRTKQQPKSDEVWPKGSSPLFAFCQRVFNPPNSSVKLFVFRYSLLHQQIGRTHR